MSTSITSYLSLKPGDRGRNAWTPEQRRAFANDLDLPVSLEAVTDNVNQSKSDGDPAEWMPPAVGTACDYATDWVLVKYRWQLTMDLAEFNALATVIRDDCFTRLVPVPSVAIGTAPIKFRDMAPETQFSTEIAWLASQGISTGWVAPDGTREYRPLSPVNRDAMAAFLYRLAGKTGVHASGSFALCRHRPGNQFYKEITWLAARGISTGWTEPNERRTFRPLEPVNRDAMAAFLYRFAGNPAFTAPAASPFVDVSTGNVFYTQITWLAKQGISTGWDIGSGCRAFRPVQPVTRDAMAAFMFRFVNGGTGAVGDGCEPGGGTPPPPPPPPPGPPANPGDTRNCGDFGTWQQAQSWFDTYYPYYGDVARLDSDGDRIACETLPGHP